MYKVFKSVWIRIPQKDRVYIRIGFFVILIIGFISIFLLPVVFTRTSIISYRETGGIGDTINGISSPFIALMAAALTFLAFYIQYRANVEQRKQFLILLRRQNEEKKEQDKIWKIERFEQRLSELLKLHRSNVDSMAITNEIKGQECFSHMFFEFRYCYYFTKYIVDNVDRKAYEEHDLGKVNALELSYRIFFFGVSEQSKKHFYDGMNHGQRYLFDEISKLLADIQVNYTSARSKNPNSKFYRNDLYIFKNRGENDIDFYYLPFNGHLYRLGRYYRHLFQIAKYISSNNNLTESEKYVHMKLLRSHLVDYEQLLLYYNAVAWFEKEWKPIFTDYRLIKNLPLQYADFGDVNPEIYFADDIARLRERDIEMFEAHEY